MRANFQHSCVICNFYKIIFHINDAMPGGSFSRISLYRSRVILYRRMTYLNRSSVYLYRVWKSQVVRDETWIFNTDTSHNPSSINSRAQPWIQASSWRQCLHRLGSGDSAPQWGPVRLWGPIWQDRGCASVLHWVLLQCVNLEVKCIF